MTAPALRIGAGMTIETSLGCVRADDVGFAPRALDIGERALVVLIFIFYFAANLASGHLLNILLALTDSVTVWCIMLRRPTTSVSLSPMDWSLAIVGTVGPMLARPGGHPVIGPETPALLWFTGLTISIAAKLSIRRSFGIGPANRGVRVSGAYAFVRHPMYLGYAFMGSAYLLFNPSAFNLAVYAVAWACQFGRVAREERWLSRDPAYRAYAKAVRFRFIPGLI